MVRVVKSGLSGSSGLNGSFSADATKAAKPS